MSMKENLRTVNSAVKGNIPGMMGHSMKEIFSQVISMV